MDPLSDATALTPEPMPPMSDPTPDPVAGDSQVRRGPICALLDFFSSVRLGIVLLVLLFVYMSIGSCLLYTSPSPRDGLLSRMPSSA